MGAVGGFWLVSCGCSWRVLVSVMWVQLGGFWLVSCGCSWRVLVNVMWVQLEVCG